MNKATLIDRLKSEMGYSDAEATRVVEAMMDVLTESLRQGDKINLPGIGTMAVVKRPARQDHDLTNSANLDLKSSQNIKFSPGKRLKEALTALDFITKDLD